uniref:Phosphatidylserine decarboxylase proenzyme 1, mitochondrial n=2 Tax=Nicotiana TaxID=4085 RepID=A0A1S4C0J6_TOBAC|nr:PREDICTED: phosphatidylserine decarboxylase proenzyme 1, mitochondrial-like [Nicotiana sylvestris]XP_016494675.1 PREDICTED: phosphatidylserine decarboxylase proenzyme 1, mitochondrial-like [Nicotiana tabacum]
MKFRAPQRIPCFGYNGRLNHLHAQRYYFTSTFFRKVQATEARASLNSGGSSSSNSSSQGSNLLLPGATVATIVMLGLLHARRLYDDQKVEEAREKGTLEFRPDAKATFMRLLPLRSISRFWGTLTSVELPMWLRPYAYKGWARAFHSSKQPF